MLICHLIYNNRIKVSCGRQATIIEDYGKMHVFGPISSPSKKLSECTDIECIGYSDDYLVTAFSSNIIFVWKMNDEYSGMGLELGDFVDMICPVPRIYTLSMNSIITSIKCGSEHTIVLTKSGECYGWGRNFNAEVGLGGPFDCLISYFHVDSPHKIPIENITDISCGENHTLALGTDARCYSWGSNDYGQLGLGNHNYKNSPQKLNLLNVVSIGCGGWHSVALGLDACWIWGLNRDGQLGLNDFSNKFVPHKLILREKKNYQIISICCGLSHTMALTGDGSLFAWGNNLFEQLGLNQNSEIYGNMRVNIPQKLEVGVGVEVGNGWKTLIKSVHCGARHTVVVTQTNEIYGWGDNSQGQLGSDNRGNKTKSFRIKI